jgi:hypothetical protein
MTSFEFQRRCLGYDRCDLCCKVRPLIRVLDKSIGEKLLELYPGGRPTLACRQCTKRLERAGHLALEAVETRVMKGAE